jgi:hypothetical protein
MQFKNTTKEEIKEALKDIQPLFNYNLRFLKLKPLNNDGTRFKVLLGVKPKAERESNKGVHISPNGRLTAWACWHAHGFLFESLFTKSPKAEIRTSRVKAPITVESGNWQDWMAGSYFDPKYASDLCGC